MSSIVGDMVVAGGIEPPNETVQVPATPTHTTTNAKPLIKVPVRQLIKDYDNNEISADQKYKGRLVEISGIVGDIKRDLLGNIYVTVGTGKLIEIPQAQCFFDEASESIAAGLSKGDSVVIRGRVEGLMMNVLIKESVVMSRSR
jgi:hypothetical protein